MIVEEQSSGVQTVIAITGQIRHQWRFPMKEGAALAHRIGESFKQVHCQRFTGFVQD
jgi:hypothetical protein